MKNEGILARSGPKQWNMHFAFGGNYREKVMKIWL
jgi:hypothetical protein